MRCALSYFDLGHVSHNSSAYSPSPPPLPGTPPHIWLLLCRFVFVIARESFARSICVEQLIGIGIAGIAPQGSPTITLPYHVFLRTYRKLPQQSRAGSLSLSLSLHSFPFHVFYLPSFCFFFLTQTSSINFLFLLSATFMQPFFFSSDCSFFFNLLFSARFLSLFH